MRDRTLAEKPPASEEIRNRQTLLLLAAPGGGRMAVPLAQVSRLEEFPRSAVERVGGQDVIQYRGEILPLVHVARVLRKKRDRDGDDGKRRRRRKARSEADGTVQVVVYAREGRPVGLVVGQILDVVEHAVVNRSGAARPGVLFTAVVQDRVTEFLDVEAVIRAAGLGTTGAAPGRAGG